MAEECVFAIGDELNAIEYPGDVQTLDGMLATLGGLPRLSQAFYGDLKRLELKFHPKNPYNKPIFADDDDNAGLLISLKVRRSKRDPTKPPKYVVSVVGHCKSFLTCFNPGDFQYLPIFADSNEPSRVKSVLNDITPKSSTDTDFFNRSKMPFLCMPALFARTDMVFQGPYRPDSPEAEDSRVLSVQRKGNFDNRDVIHFNMVDNFPAVPDAKTLKRMQVKYVMDLQLVRVTELFQECPIWSRIALLHESGVKIEKLKNIIPSLAYYFSAGPWRTLYVRYGYDPRKDFNSRYYQIFDFRLRYRSGIAEFIARRKETIKIDQKKSTNLHELVQSINYPYLEANKLPRSRQCIVRYCDIRLPKVQEMLEKIPTPLTGAMCNEKTGWLPPGFDTQVRQIVTNNVMELLRKHRQERLLESDDINPFMDENDEDSYEDTEFHGDNDDSELEEEIEQYEQQKERSPEPLGPAEIDENVLAEDLEKILNDIIID